MTAPAGFKEFVEESSTTLLRAGWLLTGDWSAAEDLVQTALAAAWPRWDSLHERPVAYAYVRRCLMSAFLRERRRKRSGEIPVELRDSDLSYRDADEAAGVDMRESRGRGAAIFRRPHRAGHRRGARVLGRCGKEPWVPSAGAIARRAGTAGEPDGRRNVTVEEQNVRDLLERFTPYPPTTVSVADIEQRLPMPRVVRLAPSRRWMPLAAAAAIVAVAVAVALTARSGSTVQRPAHPVPSPTLSLDLGPWRATTVLPGQFGQLVSAGSSLLTVDKDRVVNIVPGQGVQFSAKLPHNDLGDSLAFDGRYVWVTVFRPSDQVVLLRYSYPTLTLQGSVTLHPGRPIAHTFVLVGAPGEILVGSGRRVVTVSSTDLSTLGSLTLGGEANGLAWDASDSHLYAAVSHTNNSVVEDYARTGPASFTLRQTVPGAGSPLPGDLVLSDHGVWEIGGLNHYYLKFASFDDLAHPAQVVPPDLGDATVTVDRGIAWIGGTILGCANPDTGQLRAPIRPIVDRTGATSVLGDIVSLNGQLYAGYMQYKKGTVLQSGIVKLHPPSACTD